MATSKIIEGSEVITKEGVTVFRLGRLRIVRLDTPSEWCATLYAEDRPSISATSTAKVYNGSTYVDCIVRVGTDGKVTIKDEWGSAISGASYGYLTARFVIYFV